MKTPITATTVPAPADPARTLLDRVRQIGLADELLGEVELRVKKRNARRRAVRRSAAAAIVVALFGAFWAVPYYHGTASVATLPAHRQALVLNDGSHADLNAQTRMHTDFRYGRRIVRLDQGEAFFEVAKDPSHPFLVETPAGTVRVTGTQFNVRLTADGRPEVTLLEGKVLVEKVAAESVLLIPGQQLTFDGDKFGVHALAPADLQDVTAWRQGRLVLDGLSLAEAAARFAFYHHRTIVVAPEVGGLHLGGTCELDDLPQFLEVLKTTRALQVESSADGSYRIAPR